MVTGLVCVLLCPILIISGLEHLLLSMTMIHDPLVYMHDTLCSSIIFFHCCDCIHVLNIITMIASV